MSAFRPLIPAAALLALIAPAGAMAQTSTAPPVTLPEGALPMGVWVEGVEVSGLSALDARQKILSQLVAARRAPMQVTFRGRVLSIDPDAVGYRADVDSTITTAFRQAPAPGTTVDVPLVESIDRARLRDVLGWRATRVKVAARDAVVFLRGLTPRVRPAVFGYTINVSASAAFLAPKFLEARPATPWALVTTRVRPAVTSIGPVIVISRSQFKLRLYRGAKRIRSYPIAVGQSAYPTPAGNYQVIEKQMHPTWFPPDSPWAAGLGPVPPGAGNPLGTRWIGTSAPGIGMHGTPDSSSVGTAASHGCIRMYIGDVENLYPKVQVGTPVFIR